MTRTQRDTLIGILVYLQTNHPEGADYLSLIYMLDNEVTETAAEYEARTGGVM